MFYLYMFISLLVIWVLNILIYSKYKNNLDSPLAKKVVKNGNSIFYCVFGIAGIAISNFLWDFLKWGVVAYYGVMLIIQIFQVISGFILQIIADIKSRRVETEWWLVWASNVFAALGDAIIIAGCLKLNFGLF